MSVPTAIGLGLVMMIAVPGFYFLASFIGRLYGEDARLRIGEAMAGNGLPPPDPRSELQARADARAVRRCVLCLRHQRCDDLLAARDFAGLRAICPNTRHFDARREALAR